MRIALAARLLVERRGTGRRSGGGCRDVPSRLVVVGSLRYKSGMTGDLRTLPAAPIAALLFGAAGMTALVAVPEGVATLLVAVVVAIVGVAVAAIPAVRGAGVWLTVLGAHLVGLAAPSVTGAPAAEPVRYLVYLLALGLPLIVMVAFAVRDMLAPATGAGLLLPMVALQVREISLLDVSAASRNATAMAVGMLVGAVLLTVVVVAAPARAWWGHLAGAAAATSATVAFGMGNSPIVALLTFQWPLVGVPGMAPTPGWQVVIMTGALAVAAVLVPLAAVRRDLVTGLVAATVFVSPVTDAVVLAVVEQPAPAPTHLALAAPLAVVTLLALVAVRMPAARAALASVPAALRGRTLSSATTAACAAAVAACALVAFTVQALPALGVGGRTQGALILAGLLVAGALAHFLPAPAGAAAGVVTLVGFTVAQPWVRLLGSPTGVSVLVDVVTAVVVVWVLVERHPRADVFAAAAYLVLGTLARLFGWVVGPSAGQALVVLLLPLLVVGLPAAVLAWRDRFTPVAQAVGAVVLGAAVYLPLKQVVLAFVPRERNVGPFDPFVPTDAMGATQHLREFGWPALVLGALALVLVASVARRPSTPLAVTAALLVFCVGRVAGSLVTDVAVLAWVLGVLAVASAAVAWFTVRRA
jgi:hypothetical protein